MPGARLTHADRERIGDGLAAGLGYAEIARRLDRPTSTISREVARNGGPDGYRVEHAHLATGWRARRRITANPSPQSADDGRDPAAVRDFIERFAAMMARTGLALMPARVLVCLFATDSGSRTAAELVGYLRVSPASVSKAIGHLEALELVRREREPGTRRDRYFVGSDLWRRSWLSSASRQTTWAQTAQEGVDILGHTTVAGSRMAETAAFFAQLGEDMTGGLTEAVVDDVLTLLAALQFAATPLPVDRLAAGLGWSDERVATAVSEAERHRELGGPMELVRVAPEVFTVEIQPGRLSAAQRAALAPS